MPTFMSNTVISPIIITILLVLKISTTNVTSAQLFEGTECQLHDGTYGYCKEATKCEWLLQRISSRQLQYSDIVRCSFMGSREIVCCADDRPTGTTTERNIYFEHNMTTVAVEPETTSPPSRLAIDEPESSTQQQWPTTVHPFWEMWSPNRNTRTSNQAPNAGSGLRTPYELNEDLLAIFQQANGNAGQSPFGQPVAFPQPASGRQQSFFPGEYPSLQRPAWPPNNSPQFPQNNNQVFRPVSGLTSLLTNNQHRPVDSYPSPVAFPSPATPSLPAPPFQPSITPSFIPPTIQNLWESLRNASANFINLYNATQGGLFPNIGPTPTNGDYHYPMTNGGDSSPTNRPKPTAPRPSPTPPIVTTVSTTVPTTTLAPTPLPPRLGGRKSEAACAEYAKLAYVPLSWNILGGIPTMLGEFPHMVAIGYDGPNGVEYRCGGSLISDLWVLTAAHCISSRETPTVARMGKITLTSNDDATDPVDINITQVIRHPSYQSAFKTNDIALLRLASKVEFNDYVRPACLRSVLADVEEMQELFVTGWGATNAENSVRSDVLLKTNVTSVRLESCNSTLLDYNIGKNQKSLRNGLLASQMCAYDPQARNDACQGDSGGPIQILADTGLSTVVGVVSFGIACGTALPSVYTRVASYLDWLEPIVWPDT